MNRRNFIKTSSAALGAAAMLPLHCRKRQPNIIFILADDLGYGELGCYGQQIIRTPYLDQMAAEGMRFTQHYSGSPVCAPSRCTLFTGLHTGHSYIRDNDEMSGRGDVWRDPALEGQRPLLAGTPTLGKMLQSAGYHTALIGKWGLGGPGSSGHPNLQGFDYFYGYLCQRLAHNYYPAYLWRNDEKIILEGNPGLMPHQPLPAEADPDDPKSYQLYSGAHYTPDLMTEEALTCIRRHRNRPFALFLTYAIPHLALQTPYDSVEEYIGRFPDAPYRGDKGYLPQRWPRAAYAGMITRLDGYVGRILQLLKELQLEEETLLVFTSDNGPTFDVGGADTAFFNSSAGLRGGKTQLYEGGIRVPLVVRWTGHIPANTTSEHICAFWDFLPTMAQAAGVSWAKPCDGVSFLPTLLGRNSQKNHDHLYWEYHSRPSQAVRMGAWKAVRFRGQNQDRIKLYNLKEDPGEKMDVADNHPEIIAEMMQRMAQRSLSPIEGWNF